MYMYYQCRLLYVSICISSVTASIYDNEVQMKEAVILINNIDRVWAPSYC